MDTFAEAISRHDRIVLQCSGGRDSMSALFLVRQWWDLMTVVWCDTGAQYPETVEVLNRVEAMVPHFLRVATDQPTSLARNGHPSDVVPVAHTPLGKILSGEPGIAIRDTWSCCAENIWFPLRDATAELDATLIIRGQRANDRYFPPIQSGDIIDGVEYLFPVERWTRHECDAYLSTIEDFVVPDHFALDHSSLDCWSCTGYADKSVDRALHMRDRHPEKFAQYIKLVGAITSRVERQFHPMRRIAALKD